VQLEGNQERREGETRDDRDRGVRGSIASAPWEENAHVRDSKNKMVARPTSTNLASHVYRSAEAIMNVVKRSDPRSCRTEPKTRWGVRAAKVARVSRECTRCECTQFDWMADIGWTHCASSAPGGRKACW
jgi:hypothetical protein